MPLTKVLVANFVRTDGHTSCSILHVYMRHRVTTLLHPSVTMTTSQSEVNQTISATEVQSGVHIFLGQSSTA